MFQLNSTLSSLYHLRSHENGLSQWQKTLTVGWEYYHVTCDTWFKTDQRLTYFVSSQMMFETFQGKAWWQYGSIQALRHNSLFADTVRWFPKTRNVIIVIPHVNCDTWFKTGQRLTYFVASQMMSETFQWKAWWQYGSIQALRHNSLFADTVRWFPKTRNVIIVESDKTTSIYNVSTRVLSKK